MWGLAFVPIVVVSWIMYRYLAPESWKDWAGAGRFQAFIIAFYAGMYGFPLTIDFMARFFGLDVAWREGGNLWAQLFGTTVGTSRRHRSRLHLRRLRSQDGRGGMAQSTPGAPGGSNV